MVSTTPTYLGTDRMSGEQFAAAIFDDAFAVNQEIVQNGKAETVDMILANHGLIDIALGNTINGWSEGVRVPQQPRRWARKNLRDIDKVHHKNAEANFEIIDGLDYDDFLQSLAVMSMTKLACKRIPNWRLTALEFWSRFGARNAFAPLAFTLINSRAGRIPTKIDNDVVYDSLLKTACVTELLDNVYGASLQNPKDGPTERRLQSQRALLLENEAIIDAYENQPVEPGVQTWIFPSTPSQDMGPGSSPHIDLAGIVFKDGKLDGYFGLDVKQKSKTQQARLHLGVTEVSALDIGCERVINGERTVDYSVNSRDFIFGHLETHPYSSFADPMYRAATALAVCSFTLSSYKKGDEPICLV